MKILFTLHHYLNPEIGPGNCTINLAHYYQEKGHTVSYFSFDNLPQKLPNLGKEVLFPEFTAKHIYQLCKKEKIDVIDASPRDSWLWGKIVRQFSGSKPLVITRSHGISHLNHIAYLAEAKKKKLKLSWKYPLYRGGLELWEVATSLQCADLNLMLNSQEAEYVKSRLKVNPETIKVVRNGIPEYFLQLPFRNTSNSTVKIAQIGTYVLRKGISYSVDALNNIMSQYPQVQVGFFGTGCPAEKVYQDFAPENRDRLQVIPHYPHPNLPHLLQDYQIKLFPSLIEGFGLALIEAMACGLAPVTTCTSGPKDIITDGLDGILIPPGDTEGISQALSRLIENPSYLAKLRQNAYKTAQNYSWSQIAQENLALYQEARKS